ILFIMADDHTSQAWGCYGLRLSRHARTKNIDRIAAEGALLRNCFCTNSICVPSRATILTGQYSHVNGATTLAGRLDPDADNVAKRLQRAGYETAIVGKWHLKAEPAGFDYYNVLRGQGRYHAPILYEKGKDWKTGGAKHEGHSTDVITDLALKWLSGRKDAARPFCLMCHFKAVHEPFYSHDRYRKLYADESLPEPEDLLWPKSPKGTRIQGWPLELLKQRFTRSPNRYAPPALDVKGADAPAARRATYQKFVKDYLRAVAGLDDNVGRLLGHLDRAKQAADTVVIYTSDQGYFLGEHNLFDKRLMLEESLRMPFVVRYPREIKRGTVLEDIVLNVDFAELLLDYAEAKVPPGMQGRSFRANLSGRTPRDWRDAMYYHYWTHQPQRPSHYGIRTHEHKLIYYYGLVRMGLPPEKCWELYDLKADPHELENRYDDPKYKQAVAVLKRRLDALRKELNDTADPLKAPEQPGDKKRTRKDGMKEQRA
ncbi:MAG: sulfatase, partial [Phycisphaerae bacterium]